MTVFYKGADLDDQTPALIYIQSGTFLNAQIKRPCSCNIVLRVAEASILPPSLQEHPEENLRHRLHYRHR